MLGGNGSIVSDLRKSSGRAARRNVVFCCVVRLPFLRTAAEAALHAAAHKIAIAHVQLLPRRGGDAPDHHWPRSGACGPKTVRFLFIAR
jgi:hypothetical protein